MAQARYQEIDVPILWATVHPYGESNYLNIAEKFDWRNIRMLAEYAAISRRVSDNLGVGYIDIYNIATVFNDASIDTAHYALIFEKEFARALFYETCLYLNL